MLIQRRRRRLLPLRMYACMHVGQWTGDSDGCAIDVDVDVDVDDGCGRYKEESKAKRSRRVHLLTDCYEMDGH